MPSRQDLQALLLTKVSHVYFQPPESIKLQFPCIVYTLARRISISADNIKYINRKRYEITVIDKNPDSIIPDEINALPFCSHDRRFVVDNLYHDVFTLFY